MGRGPVSFVSTAIPPVHPADQQRVLVSHGELRLEDIMTTEQKIIRALDAMPMTKEKMIAA